MNKQSFSVNKHGQKAWGEVLAALKLSVSASSFRTWFSGSYVVDLQERSDKKILVVGVKNSFLKEQIEKRYLNFINDQLKNNSPDLEVVFVISQKEKDHLSNVPLITGVAHSYISRNRRSDTLNTAHNFTNFVVGPTNNIAHMAAVQVSNNLGVSYNPLVFWGPTGVGKTHLLQAIGNEVVSKYPECKVMYVTSEKFTNDYLESLANRSQIAFRQKYRNVDLLLFDDLQFLAGKESTQDEFFHTFNELVLSNRQVVAVCDRHPRELSKLKERLVSRFLGGMCADIGLPDFEMKVSIINSKCRERGVRLDADVVEYIAQECKGGARELEGLLTTTLAQMRIEQGLSLAVIKTGLKSQPRHNNIGAQDIVDEVSNYFKVRVSDLKGSSRRTKILLARQITMYLMRKIINLSLVNIGDFLGGKDHSTVLHSINKIGFLVENRADVRDDILRIEELLNS